jgi:glycosyltransferase involved in cell wall biosynthesis
MPYGATAELQRTHVIENPQWLGGWALAREFRRKLSQICSDQVDCVVHDHGIWLPPNHAVAAFARKKGVVRVASPRGMLSEWAMRHRWAKKRIAWYAYQRRDLVSATAFHATSEDEAREIRNLGCQQPVAVIANGVTYPDLPPREVGRSDRQTVLFLSRIHPKKGLLNLLSAWKSVAPSNGWRLVIAGPDDGGHLAEVEHMTRQLGLEAHVEFPGELDDDEKWRWYASSDIFVLPSFSENFGNVIAEALVAGLPVITTTATPWQVLTERNIGWRVRPTVNDLTEALRNAISMPREALRTMGEHAASWARSQFSWNDVAGRMSQFYQWLLGNGPIPAFIRI